MRQTLLSSSIPFQWVDVTDPSKDELQSLAKEFSLHPTSVQDCLNPIHLPKYEKIGETTFLIVRAFDEKSAKKAETLQKLTRKLAIFYRSSLLLTIHRTELSFLNEFVSRWTNASNGPSEINLVVAELLTGATLSYEKPLDAEEETISEFERRVFDSRTDTRTLEKIYVLKRRVTVIKRMLLHTLGVIQKLITAEGASPYFQNTRENIDQVQFFADELWDEVNNLLQLQISIASHRTNEVVRILTLFSVFFMPLTFIVGIYGMNFHYMPELSHPYGYIAVWIAMVFVTLSIWVWFRRSGWLR